MAVTDDGKIVGTGRIQFNSESVAQVRYMAVDPDFHGQGIGRKLMETMESYCRQSGRSSIFLQARENAVPFYLSMGYRVVEKTFLLFGEVQHFAMQKEIGVLSS
jgi:N-acetylglutamate synthase-like GNAT family acetyltransferase